MKRAAAYMGVGAVAYLLFLALTLPASVLFSRVIPAGSGITVVAPQGTPWHGEARQLQVAGAPVGHVTWSIHPLSLFTGRLDYDLYVHAATTDLRGEAALSPGGTVTLNGVTGQLDLVTALAWLRLPPNSATGRLSFNLDRFVLEDRRPTALDGKMTLDRLRVLYPQSTELGGYAATFKTDAHGIHGQAHDSGGPVNLDAVISVTPDGRYETRGTLTARAGASAGLRQALGLLGSTDAHGVTHFVFTGDTTL